MLTNRNAVSASEAQKRLDPEGTIFAAVLDVNCSSPFMLNRVVKDLHMVRRDLRRVVLLDDRWVHVGRYQITNCLPIHFWEPKAKHNDPEYVPSLLTAKELIGDRQRVA